MSVMRINKKMCKLSISCAVLNYLHINYSNFRKCVTALFNDQKCFENHNDCTLYVLSSENLLYASKYRQLNNYDSKNCEYLYKIYFMLVNTRN